MLFFGSQVIAVILAVFLHQGNGRTITSTSNYNIEGMLDLAEEELNTVFNETNENPTEREENPADVLRSSEPHSSSLEAVHSQFSDDVRGESANNGSDSVILPMEANPVWRHKRSLPGEPQCYSGQRQTVHTKDRGVIHYPLCNVVAFTACGWAIPKYGMRKCVGSDFGHYVDKETNRGVAYPKACSCAV